MGDAITGLIGAVLFAAFLVLIAKKINEIALWTVCLSGIALMLWAYWEDDIAPLFRRRDD